MSLGQRPFFSSPIFFIRLFIPLVFGVSAYVYYRTLFQNAYPGESEFFTTVAARLCKTEDLSNPLFTLLTQFIASLTYKTLTIRLNLFCCACGSIAVTLAYYFTARFIFVCSRDLPGGAESVVFRTKKEEGDDTDEETLVRVVKATAEPAPEETAVAPVPTSAPELDALPDEDLLRHNWLAAQASVLGGLATAIVLAFTAPFWLVSTRLYPHAFHVMLFLMIINMLLTYLHTGSSFALFPVVLLLTATCLEHPIFFFLLPVGGFFLLRTMKDNEQLAMHRMLGVIMVGIAGLLVSLTCLSKAASHCELITSASNRLVLTTFGSTFLKNIISWIPSYGWSYTFVLFLFPSAIALYVFTNAFHGRRTFLLLLMEIGLALSCIPAMLNLRRSLWGIARQTSEIPLFPYLMIAFFVGLLFAVFYLMRDAFLAHGDEDLEYYEYRDNPILCRIGSLLCWPLAVLVCVTPFRNKVDIDPQVGTFVDTLSKELYWSLGTRDWLINNSLFRYQIMMHAFNDTRKMRFVSTDPVSDSYDAASIIEVVSKDQLFEPIRNRMLNAADISPSAFMSEWLSKDTNACTRIAVFQRPEVWRENGYHAIPSGFFLKGIPKSQALDVEAHQPLDLKAIREEYTRFIEHMRPHLFPNEADAILLFASYRKLLRKQISRQLNELAFLFVEAKKFQEADDLYKMADNLAHDGNLSAMLNRYQLVLEKHLPFANDLETYLRSLSESGRFSDLTARRIQNENGTLLRHDILEILRKNFGKKATGCKNVLLKNRSLRDPLIALRDKKRELYQSATKAMDEYRFDEADHLLNILLDLDEKDTFVLLNKAQIAIEQRDAPNAGLWMDLAKENGIKESELAWHEASLLVLAGKPDEARKLIEQAIPANTMDARLWALLADILLEKGEFHELENRVNPALRNATSKKPSAAFYKVKGYLLLRNNDLMGARTAFLDTLGLNPSLTTVREELLKIDDRLAVPTFSEADAKAMLRIIPDHAFANYLLGRARLERGALGQAEDLFKKSLAKKVNVPAAVGLASVWIEQKQTEKAEAILRSALKEDEKNSFARLTLIKLLIVKEKGDEAFQLIQPLIKERPEDLELRMMYIRIRMKQGKFEEAAQTVSDLLDKEYKLPAPIQVQLKELAQQLSDALTR
jgi:predicted Zn-dependent protease